MYRFDGDHVVLTFFRPDVIVQSEKFEHTTDPTTGAAGFRTAGLTQNLVRENLFAVRMTIQNFYIAAQTILSDVGASEEGRVDEKQ